MGWNTGKIFIRRSLAFLIDYLLIAGYALLLLGAALLLTQVSGGEISLVDPVTGQVIGFLTLTLPVFLYFYLLENGKCRATLGKRRMGLQVMATREEGGAPGRRILLRNLLKFLPWEMAHTGVHWIIYYNLTGQYPPFWVFALLILPQLAVLAYFISMAVSGGVRTLYDRVAGTQIGIAGAAGN